MFKKILFTAFLLIAFSMTSIAQETEANKNSGNISENAVAVLPKFQGGDHLKSFYKYVQKNYVIPKNFKGKGSLIIDFVIDINGKVSKSKIINDLGHGSAEAAIKLLKKMPDWTPAYDANGNPVEYNHSLKIILDIP